MCHSLTPFATAFSSIIVLDEPTVFLDALWLPYRQESSYLEEILQEISAVKALFVHADVVSLTVFVERATAIAVFICTVVLSSFKA